MTDTRLNKRDLAAALGVTTRSIETFQRDPDFPAPERDGRSNLYSLPAVIAWFVEHKIAQRIGEADDGEAVDLNRERGLLARSQRRHRDLLYARDQGRLVDVEAVAEYVGDDYTRVRARILAIPTKAAPLVMQATTTAQVQEVLRDQVDECLRELSEPEAVAPAVVETSQ